MASSSASQHDLAERLSEVVRKLDRDGQLQAIARKVDEDVRDLRRWAKGTTLPGHVLVALLDELPRHHADHLIGGTQFRLAAREAGTTADAMAAVAAASTFTADVVERFADGEFCHRDAAAAKDRARETITRLQAFVGE